MHYLCRSLLDKLSLLILLLLHLLLRHLLLLITIHLQHLHVLFFYIFLFQGALQELKIYANPLEAEGQCDEGHWVSLLEPEYELTVDFNTK